MATRHPHTGAPNRLHSLIEWRALAEMAVLPFTWPALARLPHGDGHPVLLLPGFMVAGCVSTVVASSEAGVAVWAERIWIAVPVLVRLRLTDATVVAWGRFSMRPTPFLKLGNGVGSV